MPNFTEADEVFFLENSLKLMAKVVFMVDDGSLSCKPWIHCCALKVILACRVGDGRAERRASQRCSRRDRSSDGVSS